MHIHICDSFDILALAPRPMLVRADPPTSRWPDDVLKVARSLRGNFTICLHGEDQPLIHEIARQLGIEHRKPSDWPAIREGDRIVVVQREARLRGDKLRFHHLELVRCVGETLSGSDDGAQG